MPIAAVWWHGGMTQPVPSVALTLTGETLKSSAGCWDISKYTFYLFF